MKERMVSMALTFVIFLFFLPAVTLAGLTLKWDSNTESDLAGYKLYYGVNCPDGPFDGIGLDQGSSPINIPLGALENQSYPSFVVTTATTQFLCFKLTAYDLAGNESNFSNEVETKAVQRVGGSFSNPSDVLGWDNNVFYVGGSAGIVITSEDYHTGGTSLKIYGGIHNAARFTLSGFAAGETVVFSGWVKSNGSAPIWVRINGTNQTDWTQEQMNPNGNWQYFAISKLLSRLDSSLDINVMNFFSGEAIYLDDINVRVNKTVFVSRFNSLSDLSGWDNHVFFVEGGAQLGIDLQNFYEGGGSLKISGGIHNAARFSVNGLTAGDSVIVSGYVKSPGTNTIYARLNSASQTDWTHFEILSDGNWQNFEMEKILNSPSLDINVFNVSSPDPVYVDNINVRIGKLVYRSSFESPTDLSGFDNHVFYVEGGANLTIDSSVKFSGNSSLKIWGGLHNAARLQICELLPGSTLVFSGLIANTGTKDVYIRINTANQTDWTQSSIVPNGSWQYFYQEKNAGGSCNDFNIFSVNSDSDIFLEDVRIEVR